MDRQLDYVVRRFSLQIRPFTADSRGRPAYGHLTRVRTMMSAEQLLQRLNGHTIDVDGEPCQIDVYSIVDNDAHRWMQVGVNGEDRRTVLLKLEYLADDEDAIAAIEEWIRRSPAMYGGMVTVSDTALNSNP